MHFVFIEHLFPFCPAALRHQTIEVNKIHFCLFRSSWTLSTMSESSDRGIRWGHLTQIWGTGQGPQGLPGLRGGGRRDHKLITVVTKGKSGQEGPSDWTSWGPRQRAGQHFWVTQICPSANRTKAHWAAAVNRLPTRGLWASSYVLHSLTLSSGCSGPSSSSVVQTPVPGGVHTFAFFCMARPPQFTWAATEGHGPSLKPETESSSSVAPLG